MEAGRRTPLSDERLNTLCEHLDHDDDYEGRLGAVYSLRLSSDPRAVEPLIRALNDDERRVRDAAKDALVSLGGRAVCAALKAATGAAPCSARAHEVLLRIGETGIPVLQAVICDDDVQLACEAVSLLASLGSPDASAVVKDVALTGSPVLRRHAREQLSIAKRDHSRTKGRPARGAAPRTKAPAGAPSEATPSETERPCAPVGQPVVAPLVRVLGKPQWKQLTLDYSTGESQASPLRFAWDCFYYLTHHSNVPDILRYGILSREEVTSRCLRVRDISDPEVQRRRARCDPVYSRCLHEYVPLYFNPRNPMLYRRREMQNELVILAISPKVLDAHSHLFTDGNAAAATTRFSRDIEVVQASAAVLRADFWNDIDDGKRRRCAEVLVHRTVEAEFIVCAICNNATRQSELRATCPMPVAMNDAYFFRQEAGWQSPGS